MPELEVLDSFADESSFIFLHPLQLPILLSKPKTNITADFDRDEFFEFKT